MGIKGLLSLTETHNFRFALFYLTTLFGATAMYVFALNKGFEGGG